MRKILTRFLIVIVVGITMLTILFQSLSLQEDYNYDKAQMLEEVAQIYEGQDMTGVSPVFDVAKKEEAPSMEGKLSQSFTDDQGQTWLVYEDELSFHKIMEKSLPAIVGILVLEFVLIQLLAYIITKTTLKEFSQEGNLVDRIFKNDLVTTNIVELNPFIESIQLEKQKMDYSYDKIQQSEKMRSEFTANITHELKTPLTSISGYGEMIEAGMVKGEDIKKFAGVIQKEAKKLLELIDNIINLSKYDGHTKLNVNKEVFNIGELGRNIAEEFQHVIVHKNISLTTTIEDVDFYGDKEKIDELISNLLSNATKYNVENGKISLKIYKELNQAKIIVEDTGLGMTRKEQERIFERFYVADKSRGKKSGTGLGLSMVKHVAIIHGGRVSVSSELNKGSAFVVTLPIQGVAEE